MNDTEYEEEEGMKEFFDAERINEPSVDVVLKKLSEKSGKDFLESIYNLSDEYYGKRLEDRKKVKDDYAKLLKGIEKRFKGKKTKNEKLIVLVKGNIYLRLGQATSEDFEDTNFVYEQAAKYLKQGVEMKPSEDKIDLLISLNLGKYFRNVGVSGHKNYFQTAIGIFREIKRKIEEKWKSTGEKQWWEVHIWFDVVVNLGRVHEKIYHEKQRQEKGTDPLQYYGAIVNIVNGLLDMSFAERKAYEKIISQGYLQHDAEKEIWDSKIESFKKSEIEPRLLKDYFIQALVRTCIMYRKQREYGKTISFCEIIKNVDRENIDIINNQSVCYRKLGEVEKAIDLIRDITKRNRFAQLNYWKCYLKDTGKKGKKIEKQIFAKLKNNKNDNEVKMIYARRLRETGKWDEALKIYKEIYESAPYIKKGTIGLKAYFNVSCCLLYQKKYYQSMRILDHILSICKDDMLAGIDKGWCLMGIGQFSEASELYEKLLKSEGFYKLTIKDRMKIYNNYSEALLKVGDFNKAKKIINKALKEEKNNGRTFYIKAHCHLAKGRKEHSLNQYKKCIKYLEQVVPMDAENLYAGSDIISIRKEIIEEICKWKGKEAEYQKELIKQQLIYFPTTRYSIKTCSDLAFFIEKLEEKKAKHGKRVCSDFYKGLSRVILADGEEGAYKFSHLQKQKGFMELESDSRGRILAVLFKMFENVMGIKEQCRITNIIEDNRIFKMPAHYTSLNTLKILLDNEAQEKEQKDVPKLRLWNTVYMNDPYEGEIFIEMLKKTWAEQKFKCDDNILPRYFPYIENNRGNISNGNMNRSDSALQLAPVSNVYILSFSEDKDGIQMWVNYADNAKGCSLVFEDEFFDIHSKAPYWGTTSSYSDTDYPLYRVQYLSAEGGNIFGEENTNNDCIIDLKQMKDRLEKICIYLHEIEGVLIELNSEAASHAVREFIADMLNEIRFLFKDPEYKHEKELRLIRCSYNPKIDKTAFKIPRLYINVEKEINFAEVRLGPKFSDEEVNAIVSWLHAKKNIKAVTRSQRHYR